MMDTMTVRCLRLPVLFGTALACLLVACGPPSDPAWERVQQSGVLRVGMDANHPPFEYIAQDGSLIGLDVEIAREVSRRLDVSPQFAANLPFDGLYDALRAERVDILISGLVPDRSRMDDYAYSDPHFDAGQVLVSRAGGPVPHSLADLSDCTLGVVLGTEGDREARRSTRGSVALELVEYGTPEEALEALEKGETDFSLVNRVSALQASAAIADLVIADELVTSMPYACAVRHDSVRLLHAVDQALEAMKDDGTMDSLIANWMRRRPGS